MTIILHLLNWGQRRQHSLGHHITVWHRKNGSVLQSKAKERKPFYNFLCSFWFVSLIMFNWNVSQLWRVHTARSIKKDDFPHFGYGLGFKICFLAPRLCRCCSGERRYSTELGTVAVHDWNWQKQQHRSSVTRRFNLSPKCCGFGERCNGA